MKIETRSVRGTFASRLSHAIAHSSIPNTGCFSLNRRHFPVSVDPEGLDHLAPCNSEPGEFQLRVGSAAEHRSAGAGASFESQLPATMLSLVRVCLPSATPQRVRHLLSWFVAACELVLRQCVEFEFSSV